MASRTLVSSFSSGIGAYDVGLNVTCLNYTLELNQSLSCLVTTTFDCPAIELQILYGDGESDNFTQYRSKRAIFPIPLSSLFIPVCPDSKDRSWGIPVPTFTSSYIAAPMNYYMSLNTESYLDEYISALEFYTNSSGFVFFDVSSPDGSK